MSNKKPPAPDLSVTKLEHNLDQWLADRPADPDSIKTLIQRLRPRLVKARAQGVTYAELVAWLKTQGVTCGVSTLKVYLNARRRPAAGQGARPMPAPASPPASKPNIARDDF